MFYGLLNSRMSWKRRINTGTNTFGEGIYTSQLVASAVACMRQVAPGLSSRQLVENKAEGGMNWKLVRYYMTFSDSMNVREGDIINWISPFNLMFSDLGVIRDVADDAGQHHHRKMLVEEIQDIGEGDKLNE